MDSSSSMSGYVLVKKSTIAISVCLVVVVMVAVGLLAGMLPMDNQTKSKLTLTPNSGPSKESVMADGKLVLRTDDFDEAKKLIKQISFYDYTSIWGVDPDGKIYLRKNGEWVEVDGLMQHVSTGPSGTWAISKSNEIFYRQGSSLYKPEGILWSKIDGSLQQISSGPTGVVFGVDTKGNVVCRDKITCDNPLGTTWLTIKGSKTFRHVSCGGNSCYAVDEDGKVLFRKDVSQRNCRGTEWAAFPETKENLLFKNIQSSASGFRVVAVTMKGDIYQRMGVNAIIKPIGTGWIKLSNDIFIFSEPCHIGFIGITKSHTTRFTTAIPICRSMDKNLTQIDTGESQATWGTFQNKAYQRQGNFWIPANGMFKHVTASANEIWAVDPTGNVFHRDHVTCTNPFGSTWTKVDGKLKQLDIGKVGLLYGLGESGNVSCRYGITNERPSGKKWKIVGTNKTKSYIYVGCGEFGCWAIDDDNKIWFRIGSSKENCVGSSWKKVNGPEFTTIESGHHGLAIGVTKNGTVHMRLGTSKMDPIGTGWLHLYDSVKHATHGQLKIYIIDKNNASYKCT